MEADEIVSKILEYRQVEPYLIKSKSRKAYIVICRKLISFFLRKYTTLSLKQIGVYAGVTDHATVIFHINEINDRISVDKTTQNLIYEVECYLNGVEHDIYEEIKSTILQYFDLTDFSLNVIKKTRQIQVCQSFIAYFLNQYLCDIDRLLKLSKLKNQSQYISQRNNLIIDLQVSPEIRHHEYILSGILKDSTIKIKNHEYYQTENRRTNAVNSRDFAEASLY